MSSPPSSTGQSRSLPVRGLIIPGETKNGGVRTFIRDHARRRCAFYGHGKVALRDGIDVLSGPADPERTRVLLPSYLPSAVVEPITEAGYEASFYRITETLEPNLTDISRELDERTLALMTVNYFGFPNPKQTELESLAAEHEVRVIEDNAHSALSRMPDGQLLGTRGDIGFTSFRKTLPVPDGAVLFVSNDALANARLSRAGVRSRLNVQDVAYLARRVLDRVTPSEGSGGKHRAMLNGTIPEGRDLWDRNPSTIYEQAKGPMSKLSGILLDRIDPEEVVAEKRRAFRVQLEAVEEIEHCHPIYDSLPTGTCPQACPVRVDDWDALCASLGVDRSDLPLWPPLPRAVAQDDRFHTSQTLARRLVPLPV